MSERDILDGMLNALETLHHAIGKIVNQHDNHPVVGSPAELELKTPLSSPAGILLPPEFQLTNTFIQATSLIESAADHLIALKRTFADPILTISPWTCLRAIVEASALAGWLLDPKDTADQRIGKSFAYRFEDLSQQKAFANSMKKAASVQKVEDQIVKIERAATMLGYSPITDRNGKRKGIGERMPELTKLVKDVLNEEVTYRASSGIIHGNLSYLRQMSFQKSDTDKVKHDGVDLAMYEKNLSFSIISGICRTAVLSFSRPVWYKCIFYGWDQAEMGRILDSVSDALGITPSQRFWKTAGNP